jgi:hypothetical protein
MDRLCWMIYRINTPVPPCCQPINQFGMRDGVISTGGNLHLTWRALVTARLQTFSTSSRGCTGSGSGCPQPSAALSALEIGRPAFAKLHP